MSIKNDWLHRHFDITDGPCAGQTIRSHALTRHYETASQVPRHRVYVCRPVENRTLPGPWYEYTWDRAACEYQYTGVSVGGVG